MISKVRKISEHCVMFTLVVVLLINGAYSLEGGIRNFKFRKKSPNLETPKPLELRRYTDESGNLLAFGYRLPQKSYAIFRLPPIQPRPETPHRNERQQDLYAKFSSGENLNRARKMISNFPPELKKDSRPMTSSIGENGQNAQHDVKDEFEFLKNPNFVHQSNDLLKQQENFRNSQSSMAELQIPQISREPSTFQRGSKSTTFKVDVQSPELTIIDQSDQSSLSEKGSFSSDDSTTEVHPFKKIPLIKDISSDMGEKINLNLPGFISQKDPSLPGFVAMKEPFVFSSPISLNFYPDSSSFIKSSKLVQLTNETKTSVDDDASHKPEDESAEYDDSEDEVKQMTNLATDKLLANDNELELKNNISAIEEQTLEQMDEFNETNSDLFSFLQSQEETETEENDFPVNQTINHLDSESNTGQNELHDTKSEDFSTDDSLENFASKNETKIDSDSETVQQYKWIRVSQDYNDGKKEDYDDLFLSGNLDNTEENQEVSNFEVINVTVIGQSRFRPTLPPKNNLSKILVNNTEESNDEFEDTNLPTEVEVQTEYEHYETDPSSESEYLYDDDEEQFSMNQIPEPEIDSTDSDEMIIHSKENETFSDEINSTDSDEMIIHSKENETFSDEIDVGDQTLSLNESSIKNDDITVQQSTLTQMKDIELSNLPEKMEISNESTESFNSPRRKKEVGLRANNPSVCKGGQVANWNVLETVFPQCKHLLNQSECQESFVLSEFGFCLVESYPETRSLSLTQTLTSGGGTVQFNSDEECTDFVHLFFPNCKSHIPSCQKVQNDQSQAILVLGCLFSQYTNLMIPLLSVGKEPK